MDNENAEARLVRLERIVAIQQRELSAARKLFVNHQAIFELLATRMGGQVERGPAMWDEPLRPQN